MSNIKREKIGPGMSITTGFDSVEEMMAHLHKEEVAANKRTWPKQRALIECKEDQYYMNIAVDPRELFIVGEAWSLEHARREELKAFHKMEGTTQLSEEQWKEFRQSCKNLEDSRKRGYIMSRGYSVIEPRGELGSVHINSMWPISKLAFEECRRQGWRPDMLNEQKSPHLRQCLRELTAYVRAMMANQ